MDHQQTLARPARCSGIGLHSGAPVALSIQPAPADHGVRFRRTDISDRPNEIAAHALNVSTTQLGTNLTNASGVTVATVEHLLAAFAGLGVDNALVELDGPELPILDGSAAPFCAIISASGLQQQDAPRRRLRILKTVEIADGPKWVRLSPTPASSQSGFEAHVTIDYQSRAIGRQSIVFRMDESAFLLNIARAKTFGFAHEVEKLRSMGLARGGNLQNAIVVDGDDLLNPDMCETADEFVRHKLLDVIGDMYLAGAPIDGVYEGEQPGHALNNRLLRAVFEDDAAFVLG
ncbi:MAG: UDP-3-O-acyl-N-acetylglucosamine deacetylase [Hyphomonadaceae bacterium]